MIDRTYVHVTQLNANSYIGVTTQYNLIRLAMRRHGWFVGHISTFPIQFFCVFFIFQPRAWNHMTLLMVQLLSYILPLSSHEMLLYPVIV